MELHFLGTGSCYPSPDRGASCIILRHELGCWMFDCGEGSQIQLMKSCIKPGKINKIFITHLHGDHLFGLPGLLCTIGLNCSERRQPMEIYGPVGLRKYLRVCLELSQSQLGFSYSVHELKCSNSETFCQSNMADFIPSDSATSDKQHANETCGQTIFADEDGLWQVCQEGNLTVFAAPLKHRIMCFGYVIQEKQFPGKLDPSLLKQRGIPPGPLYSKVKNGEIITAPDGSLVTPSEVMGPPRPGRKVVILGDTCDSSMIVKIANNADVVVHEATLEDELKETCIDHGHSTPEMAGHFATSVNAKKLVLTHFSQRYKRISDTVPTNVEEDGTVSKLVEQAKKSFSGCIIAADDFVVLRLSLKV